MRSSTPVANGNKQCAGNSYEEQMTTNLVAIIVSLLLLIGGFWLLTSMDQALKSERCLVQIKQTEEFSRARLVGHECVSAFAQANDLRDEVAIAVE